MAPSFSTRLSCFLAIFLFVVPSLFAQGSREDYERALSAKERFSNKVFKETIAPSWSEDGERFVYRNRLPDGRDEFVFVDAKTGKRTTSSERDGQDGFSMETLKPVFQKIRTKKNGDATEVHFVNKSEKELELFWVDAGGKEISYGKLEAAASRTMNTYDGHVWLVRDADGKVYGYFESESVQKQAILSENKEIVEEQPGKNPAVSPDGLYELFFKDHGLGLRSVDGRNVHGESVKGPHDNIQVAHGNAGNFYEGPVFWSPDSKYIVVRKTVPGDDRKVYYVESSPKDQLQPKLHHYDYRKPGDRIPISKIHLFQIETEESGQVIVKEIPVSDELFNNMRASRSTEVYAEFGAFLESKWIGHSHKIARDHYLQVREEDFARATGKFGGQTPSKPQSSPKSVANEADSLHGFSESLQNSLQQSVANGRNASQPRKNEES